MTKLPLSVSPISGESAPSAASRLAKANYVPFHEFLRDMNISKAALIAGSHEAVERVADLSGLDVDTLRSDTPCIDGADAWFRNARFPSGQVGGKVVQGCLECLNEHPGLRGVWALPFVALCPVHRRPLTELWAEADLLGRHDVAHKLPEANLPAWPEPRDPSPFELWFLGRLDEKSVGDGWLDQFDLYSASRFCAELGRAAIATQRPKWKPLPAEHEWTAAAIGYQLCSNGEDTLRNALDHLQAMMGEPADGPRKIFGGLYDLLAVDPCPAELAPFRTILRHHMAQTWPLSRGDELLGEPVLFCKRRSIQTTSRLLQRPEKELLAALDAADVPVLTGQSEAWQVFEAADAEKVLNALNTGLTEAQFLQSLSLSDRHLRQLCEAALLMPNKDGLWDPLAAQRLIEDLLIGAEPIYVAMHGWCDLPEAAFRLKLTWPELIEQIRAGNMRVGKYLQRSGFASVLVSLGHVDQEGEAISLSAFAAGQGLSPNELIAFVRRNGLPCRPTRGPRGGAQLRVTAADRQAFHDRFISFRTLGIGARMDWITLQARLDAEGISPAAGSRRIFDRAAVAHLLP